jgi:hypothetical protein
MTSNKITKIVFSLTFQFENEIIFSFFDEQKILLYQFEARAHDFIWTQFHLHYSKSLDLRAHVIQQTIFSNYYESKNIQLKCYLLIFNSKTVSLILSKILRYLPIEILVVSMNTALMLVD